MKIKLLFLSLVVAAGCVGKGPQTPTVNGAKSCGISTTPTDCNPSLTGDFSGPQK